jgi:hypothetical protein
MCVFTAQVSNRQHADRLLCQPEAVGKVQQSVITGGVDVACTPASCAPKLGAWS